MSWGLCEHTKWARLSSKSFVRRKENCDNFFLNDRCCPHPRVLPSISVFNADVSEVVWRTKHRAACKHKQHRAEPANAKQKWRNNGSPVNTLTHFLGLILLAQSNSFGGSSNAARNGCFLPTEQFPCTLRFDGLGNEKTGDEGIVMWRGVRCGHWMLNFWNLESENQSESFKSPRYINSWRDFSSSTPQIDCNLNPQTNSLLDQSIIIQLDLSTTPQLDSFRKLPAKPSNPLALHAKPTSFNGHKSDIINYSSKIWIA